MGQILSSTDIDTSLVASKVTVLKSYPFIGVMGFTAGENPLSYPEIKYETVRSLVANAAKLVDYVLLDCSSNMTNFFTPAAIESADTVIRILTPDLKGVNYLKAHQPLLTDARFKYHEHLTFAGMARPFHAIEEMGHIIGGFDDLLPYGKEIDRCATEGNMFGAIQTIHRRCGEPQFRMAIQHLFDTGHQNFTEKYVDESKEQIRRNTPKNAIMTEGFQCELLDRCLELSRLPVWDILILRCLLWQ